jgi:hypothetical protein
MTTRRWTLHKGDAERHRIAPVAVVVRAVTATSLLLASLGVIAALQGSPAAASSLSNLTFAPNTTAGGATYAQWTVGFTATSALPYGSGTITVDAPTGTTFGDFNSCFDYVIDDTTTGQSWCASSVDIKGGGNEATLTVNDSSSEATVNAGDSVTVTVNDVTNPSSGTAFSGLSLYSSSDTTAVSYSGSGRFTGANSVQNLSFSPNTTAAGAT